MAMTLPIAIPSTPSAGNSPASDDSSNPPRTPISPSTLQTLALPSANDSSATASNAAQASSVAQMKRKPSRRANTAERRATHNAVERQRRETLNGRFLDLAALLPNLSQIRRPSKSSIVNSSIAHIHAARRHRLLAARELRLLKLESDALRRELNEWRDRAGLPRVEEPARGEGFAMVMSGELEVLAVVPGDDEEDENGEYGDDDYPREIDDVQTQAVAAAAMLKNVANPFAHNIPSGPPPTLNLSHIIPRTGASGPMIASSPTGVSFENPAIAALYDQHQHQHQHHTAPFNGPANHFLVPQTQEADKWQMFAQAQAQAQRALFTPPTSAHGFTDPNQAAFFGGNGTFVRQGQQMGQMHGYGSPDGADDTSSVGSGRSRGERYETPPGSASDVGSYEMSSGLGEYPSRRGMYGDGMGGMGGGMKPGMSAGGSPPINVGGGGSGGGFMMMM